MLFANEEAANSVAPSLPMATVQTMERRYPKIFWPMRGRARPRILQIEFEFERHTYV